MIDKSNFRFNKVISPETKYMHLMEALEEAQRNFLRVRRKGETFRLDRKCQSSLICRRWK
ncbi:hypothetical protein [Methanobacterium oryzae]|uniref:hypothetical protein n=1 Tax=Methanobacterium oryzae TaxID=69540 RepID=UPI003D1C824A